MKQIILALIITATVISCKTKKSEQSNNNIDSASYDIDSIEQADIPAPSILASSNVSGYTTKNLKQTDSISFELYLNEDAFNNIFNAADKQTKKPDFVINYVLAVTTAPSSVATNVSIEKVELNGQEMSVYLNSQRGEKQSPNISAAQIFEIEKRNEVATMQLFLNGKKGKAFFLTGL